MKLLDYYLNFVKALREQLEDDQERWGDTWKHRPIEALDTHDDLGELHWPHQNERIFERYRDYYAQWKNAGTPIPWLKICGEAFIAWVRERNPNTYHE